jgi:hypothetical protein
LFSIPPACLPPPFSFAALRGSLRYHKTEGTLRRNETTLLKTMTVFPQSNPIQVYLPRPNATLKGETIPAVLHAVKTAPSNIAMKKNLPERDRSKRIRTAPVRVITTTSVPSIASTTSQSSLPWESAACRMNLIRSKSKIVRCRPRHLAELKLPMSQCYNGLQSRPAPILLTDTFGIQYQQSNNSVSSRHSGSDRFQSTFTSRVTRKYQNPI